MSCKKFVSKQVVKPSAREYPLVDVFLRLFLTFWVIFRLYRAGQAHYNTNNKRFEEEIA